MNEIYRQAFSEIDEILKIMPLNLLEKIISGLGIAM